MSDSVKGPADGDGAHKKATDSGSETKPVKPGRGKNGKPYKPGNTRADGSYETGKYRTPKHSQFRKGDGRRRGRRPKGSPNIDTFIERELRRKVTLKENGKERKLSKAELIELRLLAKAFAGDLRAIDMVHERRKKIAADKEESARRYHQLQDTQILHRYLEGRQEELDLDPDLFDEPLDASDDEEPSDD